MHRWVITNKTSIGSLRFLLFDLAENQQKINWIYTLFNWLSVDCDKPQHKRHCLLWTRKHQNRFGEGGNNGGNTCAVKRQSWWRKRVPNDPLTLPNVLQRRSFHLVIRSANRSTCIRSFVHASICLTQKPALVDLSEPPQLAVFMPPVTLPIINQLSPIITLLMCVLCFPWPSLVFHIFLLSCQKVFFRSSAHHFCHQKSLCIKVKWQPSFM
jgi:hypothetical protein